MIFWIFLLITALYFLYKVSEIAEEELVRFAEYSGITHMAVGFIFLATATSLPELSISISSAFLKNQEISVGISIGNILYDLLLILPLVAIWRGLRFDEKNIRKIKLISLISLLALFPIILLKSVERIYGIALVISFLIFCRFFLQEKLNRYRFSAKEEKFRNKLTLSFSLIAISLLSFIINLSTERIAELANISILTIGSLFVSVFTASPELFTCLAAAKKKNYDIVVGTLYGTLIFDTLFVIGATSIISPIPISDINQFLLLYCFLFATLISIILMIVRKREIDIGSSVFLLMLFALWIFLSILLEI